MSTADKLKAESTADEKDVLDFINSLPDSKSGTPKPHKVNQDTIIEGKGEKVEGGNEEDFLEFLDELAQHEKKVGGTIGTPSKLEPKKKDNNNIKESYIPLTNDEQDQDEEGYTEKTTPTTTDESANEEINVPDPISTISNWWSKEGSTKVNNFWDSLASNAQNLGEQTYQLASTTTNQINQQRQQNSLKLNDLLENVKHIILDDDNDNDDYDDSYDDYLRILVSYDMLNIKYIHQLINQNFKTIMKQVEGNIKIKVIDEHQHNTNLQGKLNMFYGKIIDGEKLCFANLDSSIKNFKLILDEKTEEEKLKLQKRSNIFISIQPITSNHDHDHIISSSDDDDDKPILIESNNSDSFSFTIILKDITNNITIITKTQPFPLKWAKWLDGEDKNIFKPEKEEKEKEEQTKEKEELTKDDNDTINEELGIDPSEWVKDWIKQGLNLSFGILIQEYIIKRMGI
ncbi:maintenance of telomere capping protein 1 [Scheffersomyces coipomensis]|uniref:maintenance of telomere capping protein 1 n=1 Tax=Scheffersomyces coipomensis TaxID=1788519 RepID=UPI00315D9361